MPHAPACTETDNFYYKEKKLSFTKLEDVYKRSLQAAKKKNPLTFHWRGGYFTKEIIQEIVDEIRKVASEKNLTAMISMNYAQAVVRVHFESPYLQEELLMQGANEGEKYEGE